MISSKEVDAFVLDVMQRAFLNLRECGGRADQTILLELQQAMQLLPPPITSETPLSAIQQFLQYGRNEFRRSGWMPGENRLEAMWRGLAALTEEELKLVSAGGSLISFACAQDVERRRVERNRQSRQPAPALTPGPHASHKYRDAPATLRVKTDYGTMDLCPACAAALVAGGYIPDPNNVTEPTGSVCECEHVNHATE